MWVIRVIFCFFSIQFFGQFFGQVFGQVFVESTCLEQLDGASQVRVVLLSAKDWSFDSRPEVFPDRDIQNQIALALPPNVKLIRYLRPDVNIWIRDWFPEVFVNTEGTLSAIGFDPFHEQMGSNAIDFVEKELSIPTQKVSLKLDWGNVLWSDQNHVFLSRSILREYAQRRYYPLTRKQIEERLKSVFKDREIVWLPELPNEPTGHVDMYVSYLGKGKFLVADSRVQNRKNALDQTAKIIQDLGYTVYRVSMAGSEVYRQNLSYTNLLVVNDHILLPVYSKYAEGLLNEKILKRSGIFEWLGSWMGSISKKENQREFEKELALVQEDDLQAIQLLTSLGFKVKPIVMNETLEKNGMVHCMTKTLSQKAFELLPEL